MKSSSSESPVPKIVGLAEFLISTIPIIIKSFELLFNMYFKIPNLTKSGDVVLTRHNNNTGSLSISSKGESLLNSSVNDESEKSLVDITLSILKISEIIRNITIEFHFPKALFVSELIINILSLIRKNYFECCCSPTEFVDELNLDFGSSDGKDSKNFINKGFEIK
ncbi:hypothetical protein H8356DRAFT_1321995 [Neocallimastix lanati (nom. inval.)]|nr:hypothetical protein H8356DRAFT_1321995 [Neocallimastix sp. JGI-2020a]